MRLIAFTFHRGGAASVVRAYAATTPIAISEVSQELEQASETPRSRDGIEIAVQIPIKALQSALNIAGA